jgi:D-alanyl-D-alanine-carboxypeptidase/D-alanyl-D-alanine-endopeptidase
MKRWFSIFLQLVVLLALSSCGITTGTSETTKASRLPDPSEVKALLVHLVDEEKRAPGMVIGMIADDPQERWVIGYGKLSATDERVPDGDTVFEIGSITKVFTGILLAQAVLSGEVQLDDPISLYLPEGVVAPEYEGKSITLLDLATHYSGLPPFNTTDISDPCEEFTIGEMYDLLSGYHLTRPPGSIHDYSNLGFSLLGDLLARGAGKADYEALLLERIALPLGMDSTRIQLTTEMQPRLAPPHYDLLPACSDARSAFYPAGGIRSTANDMLTFLAANMGMTETELQPAMQLANTSQRPTGDGAYTGLGWYTEPFHHHGGRTGGYYSLLAWDPQRKIGVVVLSNDSEISIQEIGYQLLLGITSGRAIPRSIEIILTTWVILTAGCLAFLVWELWRRRPVPNGARLMWLLTTAFLGPLGLVIYWISVGGLQRSGDSVGQVSPVRRALGSAAWAAAGNVLGGIGVLALRIYLPNVVGANLVMQIAVVLLIPLFVGWLISSVSRWISRSTVGQDFPNQRPLFAEVVSTCLVLAVLFPIVNTLSMRWFYRWNFPDGVILSYPPVWGALCLGAIVGTLVTYPFHLWMLRRGLFRWGTEAISEVAVRGLAWYVKVALVVLSFVIMLGAMFLAMQIA